MDEGQSVGLYEAKFPYNQRSELLILVPDILWFKFTIKDFISTILNNKQKILNMTVPPR